MMPKHTLRPLHRSPRLWLAAALLAPFLPILLHPAGRILASAEGDGPKMFYFINAFAGACWRGGSIPLWNPYIMLGQPFLGEGQAALFHPLSWLFIALPTGAAYNWIVACCLLFAGLAFYGYLRALRLSTDTAFCGALVWSFSNIFVARIAGGHLTNLLIFFELPLMLMFWERHRQSGSLRPLLGLALVYALMILAAHPQFLYIFSLFFMCYVLVQSAVAASAGRAAALEEGKAIVRLGGFVLLGIGLGAVQLLPTADFARESSRTLASIEFCGSFSFPFRSLLTLLAPHFFGFTDARGFGQYWGGGNIYEMLAYLGLLPLVLLLPGVFAAPRRRRLPLLACALLFLLLALGNNTPLFPLIYKYVPGFNIFRGPSKCMHVTLFCLATFSAYGLEALLHPRGAASRRNLWAALGVAAAGFVVALTLFVYLIPFHEALGSHWRQLMGAVIGFDDSKILASDVNDAAHVAALDLLRAMLFLALAALLATLAWSARWGARWPRARRPLALALILADLLCVFLPLFKTDQVARIRVPEALAAPLKANPAPPRVLAPEVQANAPMLHGFSSPSGYVGANLERYNRFINAAQGVPLDTAQLFDPINNYVPGLRFFAFDYQILMNNEVTSAVKPLAQAAGQSLVRFPEPFPRAYLAATPRACANEQEALQYVLDNGQALLESPAVEPGAAALPPAAPLAADEQVRITAFSPNRVELEAKAAQPRLLALAEAWEKNWKATVNGKPAPVLPANHLFRGVIVPKGTSRIVFTYAPAAFRWGALLSLLSLSGALALGLRLRREQPRAPLDPLEEAPEREAQPAPPQAPARPAAPPAAARAKKTRTPAKGRKS